MEVIAVYGTLRKGAYNYKFLKKFNPIFIGKGKTKDFYLLMIKNSLPFAIPCALVPIDYKDLCNNLVVEVYEISEEALSFLDEFEEHPYVYVRRKKDIIFEKTGRVISAWLYEYPKFDKNGLIIQSGDYLEIEKIFR